jgi:GTP-binding protein
LPEIAFIGRSNVGKSSLLNALVGQKGLARVSSTPGKTQHLNIYALPACYLVDLPGYGWARASKRDREAYKVLVDTYLRRRGTLRGVVWLLDVRHPPSREDHAMQNLLAESGRPTLVVLTKTDKLSQARRAEAIRSRASELGLAVDELQPTSSSTGAGIDALGASVLAAVEGER